MVAVGPSAHEIIAHDEADFEIRQHVGIPGRDFYGSSGTDAIAAHGQVGIQQSRYMILTHRVPEEQGRQFDDLPVVVEDRAELLPEAPLAIEVGRLAAWNAL